MSSTPSPRSVLSNYIELGPIGEGTFGKVSKIRRITDNELLVWKELYYGNMSEKEKQQLVSEVNILRELNHINVVRYYDRIIDREKKKIYIIMEYCSNGDLSQLIKHKINTNTQLDEEFIWKILSDIILALYECHRKLNGSILHRDLKPGNIFLNEYNIAKLGDFGLARILKDSADYAKTHVGTPYYMSPEQVKEHSYNRASDIWSLGCLIYELCSLSPPFKATNHLALAMKIQQGKFNRIPLNYSNELDKLIRSMIQIEPIKRPTIEQLMNYSKIQSIYNNNNNNNNNNSNNNITNNTNAAVNTTSAVVSGTVKLSNKEIIEKSNISPINNNNNTTTVVNNSNQPNSTIPPSIINITIPTNNNNNSIVNQIPTPTNSSVIAAASAAVTAAAAAGVSNSTPTNQKPPIQPNTINITATNNNNNDSTTATAAASAALQQQITMNRKKSEELLKREILLDTREKKLKEKEIELIKKEKEFEIQWNSLQNSLAQLHIQSSSNHNNNLNNNNNNNNSLQFPLTSQPLKFPYPSTTTNTTNTRLSKDYTTIINNNTNNNNTNIATPQLQPQPPLLNRAISLPQPGEFNNNNKYSELLSNYNENKPPVTSTTATSSSSNSSSIDLINQSNTRYSSYLLHRRLNSLTGGSSVVGNGNLPMPSSMNGNNNNSHLSVLQDVINGVGGDKEREAVFFR